MNFNRLTRYALPLGLLAFCWLSMQTVVAFTNESMKIYGFPFGWYAPNAGSSMAFTAALGPLVIDILVYVLACHILVARFPSGKATKPKILLAVSVALWVAALASLALLSIYIGSDLQFVSWSLDSYFSDTATRNYSFQFGPGRWS
jgi:uncharacterized membrane protein